MSTCHRTPRRTCLWKPRPGKQIPSTGSASSGAGAVAAPVAAAASAAAADTALPDARCGPAAFFWRRGYWVSEGQYGGRHFARAPGRGCMTGSCREQKRNYSRSYRFHQKQYITELEAERYMPAVTRYTWHHMHPHPLLPETMSSASPLCPVACVLAGCSSACSCTSFRWQTAAAHSRRLRVPHRRCRTVCLTSVHTSSDSECHRQSDRQTVPRCILIAAPGTGRR